MSDAPAARAVALVERLFALLHECRALVPQLERAGAEPEAVSALGPMGADWLAQQERRLGEA